VGIEDAGGFHEGLEHHGGGDQRMGEGLEWPVIRDPQIVLPGEGSGGLHVFPTEIQEREAIEHGEIPRAEGHGAVIQLSAERGRTGIPKRCRLHGGQGPDEHDPVVVGRGDEEFPAEESGKLLDMDVGHAPASEHVPDLRVLGHARSLDRWQHQRLEADGAVLAPEVSKQRRHHAVGGSVVGLAGISLDGRHRGKAHEEPQARPLCRREQIPGSQEFNVRDKGEIFGGHLVEESVPEDAGAVNDAVDPAIAAGHLSQGDTNRLGVGYIAGQVHGLDSRGVQILQGPGDLPGSGFVRGRCG
jgi:hypothetical protein